MITPTKGHRHATQLNLLPLSYKDASGMPEIIQFDLFLRILHNVDGQTVAHGR